MHGIYCVDLCNVHMLSFSKGIFVENCKPTAQKKPHSCEYCESQKMASELCVCLYVLCMYVCMYAAKHDAFI